MKFAHVNIITKDYEKLSKFYMDVFGCEPTGTKRNLSGKSIDNLTKIEGAVIKGQHLKLPGYKDGPTIEIFEYSPESSEQFSSSINSFGFGHIAFLVDDVKVVFDKLIKNGGSALGDIVELNTSDHKIMTVVYAKDPDGNYIEIQSIK